MHPHRTSSCDCNHTWNPYNSFESPWMPVHLTNHPGNCNKLDRHRIYKAQTKHKFETSLIQVSISTHLFKSISTNPTYPSVIGMSLSAAALRLALRPAWTFQGVRNAMMHIITRRANFPIAGFYFFYKYLFCLPSLACFEELENSVQSSEQKN